MAPLALLLFLLALPLGADAQDATVQRTAPLLTEPLTESWRTRLVPPLVARLQPLGSYAAAETTPATMPDLMRGSPDALALLRRSSFAAMPPPDGLEAIEIGPAACLLLAVADERPWAAYADLNYAGQGLRVASSGPVATSLLRSLTTALPLSTTLRSEERPVRVAFQHLKRGEVDLVAFDAPRQSGAQTAALSAELARERGLRLLVMPTLPQPAALSAGKVQLDAGSWLTAASTQDTVCDPFLLVLRDERAEKLLHHLYDGDATHEAAAPSPSFVEQVQEAARSLASLIGAAAARQ